ncbi:hypothetical protein ONS96_006261 [Cadophora gregata f. sp. sojae]|nr:hypothetical protein ONS96_006261 [Cadophora gregata f. sp. sojae]
MAILNDGNDTYEVRIKRYPDGTYFDEHIKVEEREKLGARKCTRYLVGEADMRYTIEFTLHKGFDFGTYDRAQAQLYFPGITSSICHLDVFKPLGLEGLTSEDITKKLEYADVIIGGRKMLGTRFAFRGLAADENLKSSTDITGIDPQNLGFFEVILHKLRWEQRPLSSLKHGKKVAKAKRAQLKAAIPATIKESKKPWDAKKVDEASFSKDGLTCAVGFVGGKAEMSRNQQCLNHHGLPQSPGPAEIEIPLTESVAITGPFMGFYFRYRSAVH